MSEISAVNRSPALNAYVPSTPLAPASVAPSQGPELPKDTMTPSSELQDREPPSSGRDLSSLKAAFGPGVQLSGEELGRAQSQGKTGDQMKQDRGFDQQIVDHVCGDGCGCKPKPGDDPLKALEMRDEEVKKHENDHLVEAGENAIGGPTYTTKTASNGRAYVVGGEVQVDVSEVKGNPKKTADKMKQIQRAALKPEQPSDKDRQVAREAAVKQAKAESEMGGAQGSTKGENNSVEK